MDQPVEQGLSSEHPARQNQSHEDTRDQAVDIAQRATRRLRRTAVTSSGDKCSNSVVFSPEAALLKYREALLLENRAGGGRFEKGDVTRSAGIGRSCHDR